MNSTERNLAEGVCESIRHATPNFHWRRSSRPLWIAGVVIFGLLAMSAFAGRAHAETLFEATSAQGESQRAFLRRVGVQMRDGSDTSRFEACASIGSDGERFGVVVTTSGSHIACKIDMANVPAGMQPTGETIHTHGANRRFTANRADQRVAGMAAGEKLAGQHLDKFGPGDWAVPGYLAAPDGVLLYQNGEGTQREVTL